MTPDEKVRLKNRTCRMWFSRATPLRFKITISVSTAGKMHDDLKKSAKDDTLEHSIIAAVNCD